MSSSQIPLCDHFVYVLVLFRSCCGIFSLLSCRRFVRFESMLQHIDIEMSPRMKMTFFCQSEPSTTSFDQSSPFMPTKEQKKRPLSKSFLPEPSDAICARGREARNHPGNVLLRSLIDESVKAYESAQSLTDKSRIVSTILCVP